MTSFSGRPKVRRACGMPYVISPILLAGLLTLGLGVLFPLFGGAVEETGTFGSLDPNRNFDVYENGGQMMGVYRSDAVGRLTVPLPTGENTLWIMDGAPDPTPTNTAQPTPTRTPTPTSTGLPIPTATATPTPPTDIRYQGLGDPLAVESWGLYR